MSETFRQANIGADIQITGLEKLLQANAKVDELINKFRSLGNQANTSASDMNRFTTSANDINKVDSSVKSTTDSYKHMTEQVSRSKEMVSSLTRVSLKQNQTISEMKQKINELNQTQSSVKQITDKFTDNNKAIAENVEQVKSLQKVLGQLHADNIKKLGSESEQTGKKAQETESKMKRLKDTMMGTFAGTAIANGLSSIPGFLKDMTVQGLKFASAGADVKKNWQNAGLNDNDANSMIKQLGDIRSHADIAAGSIVAMQKKYLAMTNGNVQQAEAITNTMNSFGKASGMTERQQRMMDRMMTAKKIDTGMFDKSVPVELRNEIIKTSGMTNIAFENAMKKGKITGETLRNYMVSASKDSGEAWNNYFKTDKGKLDMLNVTVANTKKSFATAISGNLFTEIQKVIGNGKNLIQVRDTIQSIAKTLGTKIGKGIGEAIGFVTKNQKPLKEIGSAIWNIVKAIGSSAWNTIKELLAKFSGQSKNASKGLQGVADSMTAISKHQDTFKNIGKWIVYAFAAKKVLRFGKGLLSVVKTLGLFMSPLVSVAKHFGKVGTVMKRTGSIAKAFRFLHPKATKGILTGVKLVKGFGRAAKTVFSFLGSKAVKIATGIMRIVKAINFAKIASKAWSVATKVMAGAQAALNIVLNANPIGLIVAGVAGVTAGLVLLYKKCKPFRKFVNGMFKSIGNGAKALWKTIKKSFGGFKSYMEKHFGNALRATMNEAKRIFKVIQDAFKVFKDLFSGNWKDLGKDIEKLAGDLWKAIKGAWNVGIKWIEDLGSNMWNAIWDSFKSWGGKIGNFFVDLWQGIKDKVSNGINDVTGIINVGIKGLNWVLGKLGGSGHTIGLIPKVKLATGTLGGKLVKDTFAMLNDGHDSPETGNKELAILPNGKSFIPQQRNWTGILPKGTAVLNAKETKSVMHAYGIHKYAKGTGYLKNITSSTNNFGNKISHFANGTSFIKTITNTFNNSNHSANNSSVSHFENGTNLISSIANKMAHNSAIRYANGTISQPIRLFGGTTWNKFASGASSIYHGAINGAKHIYNGAKNYVKSSVSDAVSNVKKAWNFTKGVGGNIFNGIKDVAGVIAHPIKFITGLLGGLPKLPEYVTDLGNGMISTAKKWIVSFFKKNNDSGADNPKGTSVERWRPVIKKAAAFMHETINSSDMNALLARIAKESGGNPTIMQQVHDINSANGTPAQGLFQYVPSTFNSWAVSGYHKLLNGFDQMLAVLNDSNWRSDVRMPGGWGPTGHRMRFAGGIVDKNELSIVNEKGPELAINPNTQSFRVLGNGKPALVKLTAGEHVVTAESVRKLIKNGSNVANNVIDKVVGNHSNMNTINNTADSQNALSNILNRNDSKNITNNNHLSNNHSNINSGVILSRLVKLIGKSNSADNSRKNRTLNRLNKSSIANLTNSNTANVDNTKVSESNRRNSYSLLSNIKNMVGHEIKQVRFENAVRNNDYSRNTNKIANSLVKNALYKLMNINHDHKSSNVQRLLSNTKSILNAKSINNALGLQSKNYLLKNDKLIQFSNKFKNITSHLVPESAKNLLNRVKNIRNSSVFNQKGGNKRKGGEHNGDTDNSSTRTDFMNSIHNFYSHKISKRTADNSTTSTAKPFKVDYHPNIEIKGNSKLSKDDINDVLEEHLDVLMDKLSRVTRERGI